MTVTLVTQDFAALPAELLPLVKQHCRVDHTNDDALLTSIIARAIARFQADTEVTVNPTAVSWTPKLTDFTSDMATLPVRPATLATPITGYAVVLKWDSIHGIPIQVLQGTAADGLTVDLLCGYPNADAIPPDVQDEILRSAAHLYEHREILVPGGRDFVSPDLAKNAAWWMPKA
jgi:hypothetical protein